MGDGGALNLDGLDQLTRSSLRSHLWNERESNLSFLREMG